MYAKTIRATYERGVLRPEEPIDLDEGTRVELTIVIGASPRGSSPAAILAAIAALPAERGERDGFSGRDHDDVLYGGGKPS